MATHGHRGLGGANAPPAGRQAAKGGVMARKATGQIIEREGKNGRTYALRFRAYGKRRFITTAATKRAEAELELSHDASDVQGAIWQPQQSPPHPTPTEDEPTFHEFASQWGRRPRSRGARATNNRGLQVGA